jgi:uncharacterized protein YcbK (DUF882 family)
LFNITSESDGTTTLGGGSTTSSSGGGFEQPLIPDSQIKKVNNPSIGIAQQSNTELTIPSSFESYFINTKNLNPPTANDGTQRDKVLNVDISEAQQIRSMNEFLYDRLDGFAAFLNDNYPNFKGKIIVSSGIRNKPNVTGSQHLRGEAIDFHFVGTVEDKLENTHTLFNALLQYHRVNNYEWDQILLETRVESSVWIHWSYSRNHPRGIYQDIIRMYGSLPGGSSGNNDKSISAGINTANRNQKPVSSVAKTYNRNETRTWDLAGEETRDIVTTSDFDNKNTTIRRLTDIEKLTKGCTITNRLQTDLGLTLEQATGIVGNLIKESGLIASIIQGSGLKTGIITESGGWDGTQFTKEGGNLGYGWAQWTFYTLKNGFIDYAKEQNFDLINEPATDEINYGYLVRWINNSPALLNNLKQKTSVYESAKYFAQNYERCAKCQTEGEWKERGDYGKQIYDYCIQN